MLNAFKNVGSVLPNSLAFGALLTQLVFFNCLMMTKL